MIKPQFTMSTQGFKDSLGLTTDRLLHLAGGALKLEGELIMTDSKEHYVPVDEGTLRDSGHVTDPTIQGSKVFVELGFGGEAEPYAWVQHENLEFKHKVGGPKFLETPMLQAAPQLGDRLAQRIRAAQ